MSIGANIKKRRFELGLSQQELADLMGYKTRSTIAKIESGENDVSHKKLARFAQVLDTTPEALAFGAATGPMPQEPLPKPEGAGRTAAVILAGGKSSRNQQNVPNQFINILGKPVIVYCLQAYENHPAIDDIYVVCLKGWEQIMAAYARQYRITKLKGILPGGPSGILSVKSGLDALRPHYGKDDIIIFQESTRPMINGNMISKLLQVCYEKGSVNLCQPMRDILQFTFKEGRASYVDRDSVVEAQSPEAYRFGVISQVFDAAEKRSHPLQESCCAMLMYNLGFEPNFVEGSVTNYKILRQEDIAIVSAMLQG
ncbi:MAG: XRE family transcriptional regulator [Clostridia bacterium]|nr:XRE family transcriptional regulator [Clostridia bacterium]